MVTILEIGVIKVIRVRQLKHPIKEKNMATVIKKGGRTFDSGHVGNPIMELLRLQDSQPKYLIYELELFIIYTFSNLRVNHGKGINQTWGF